jgi:hypothetical protein
MTAPQPNNVIVESTEEAVPVERLLAAYKKIDDYHTDLRQFNFSLEVVGRLACTYGAAADALEMGGYYGAVFRFDRGCSW